MAIRKFTDSDWLGLAGSECWVQNDERKQPLICDDFPDATGMFMTADKNGLFLYVYNGDEEGENSYTLSMDIPSQEVGRCLLRGVVDQMLDLIIHQQSPVQWALANGFEEC